MQNIKTLSARLCLLLKTLVSLLCRGRVQQYLHDGVGASLGLGSALRLDVAPKVDHCLLFGPHVLHEEAAALAVRPAAAVVIVVWCCVCVFMAVARMLPRDSLIGH